MVTAFTVQTNKQTVLFATCKALPQDYSPHQHHYGTVCWALGTLRSQSRAPSCQCACLLCTLCLLLLLSGDLGLWAPPAVHASHGLASHSPHHTCCSQFSRPVTLLYGAWLWSPGLAEGDAALHLKRAASGRWNVQQGHTEICNVLTPNLALVVVGCELMWWWWCDIVWWVAGVVRGKGR